MAATLLAGAGGCAGGDEGGGTVTVTVTVGAAVGLADGDGVGVGVDDGGADATELTCGEGLLASSSCRLVSRSPNAAHAAATTAPMRARSSTTTTTTGTQRRPVRSVQSSSWPGSHVVASGAPWGTGVSASVGPGDTRSPDLPSADLTSP